MTNQPITIPAGPLEHPAMDYAFLREEGIRHLERMAGQLWTDFNTHDPGITILEQLCFALTDLGYRIAYELPDLLSREGEPTYDSLYSPAQILTSNPVTLTDLRKLVIDVPGVKNAWVEKVEEQEIPLYFRSGDALSVQGDAVAAEPVFLRGLHRVLIEISHLLYTDGSVEQIEEVRREVVRQLHSHRGLCEDFESIKVLEPQEIRVSARIEIDAESDAGVILHGIFQKAADYISPPVRRSSLEQLFEAGQEVDQIFDGPLLKHGFIDSDELRRAQRRTDLRTSDLIREIMDVSGVRAVRTISISAGVTPEQWLLRLDPDKAPILDLSASSIVLERSRLPASVDVDSAIDAHYQQLRESDARQRITPTAWDIPPPPGRDRKVGSYYSIQDQFPATYGIGEMGLPESASPRRKAQAKQLKAYLMFFDQLLANYFSQLAHVRDLFSFSAPSTGSGQAPSHTTYFSQMIDDPALAIDDIRRSGPSDHRTRLQQITENPYASSELPSAPGDSSRRNRFLNHLMARFAERFTEYSLLSFGANAQERTSSAQKTVQDKQAFLKDYPRISRARGTAFDCMAPYGGANISGLEQRIKRLLGLDEGEDEFFYLVEHILLRPMEGDENQRIPVLEDIMGRDPYSLQLSFMFPAWPQRFQDGHGEIVEFISRTVREETPAHLIPYIQWLDRASMATFEAANLDWLDQRRRYWTQKFGV